MNNKLIKKVLVAAMMTTAFASSIPMTNANALANEKSVENPILVPTPKKVTYQDNILSITSTVNIKGQDVADPDAIRELT